MTPARPDSATQLPHLWTFVKAAEIGSFTGAGKATGMTQAAVSQRIHSLEQILGAPLFLRESGRVELTDAGRALHRFAGQILALDCEARAAICGMPLPIKGELRLAASSVPGEYLLPNVLSIFGRKWPHIKVSATVADSRLVLEQVEHGKADLGLVGLKEDRWPLKFEEIGTDELMLIVPSRHAWSRKRRVSIAELCDEPLILREPGSGSRECFEKELARHGRSLSDLKIVLELGSNEAVKKAVQSGMGAAVLSSKVVEPGAERGRFHCLHIVGFDLRRSIFAVHDFRRALPIAARLFADFVGSGSKT